MKQVSTIENPVQSSPHHCPACGSNEVLRSSRRGLVDRVLSTINLYPYRCRQYDCEKRFFRFGKES
jgi:predicted RNA-binding Zn-ribbon protein involved in translation (DUF1610 family)